jgi:hypothetical protein
MEPTTTKTTIRQAFIAGMICGIAFAGTLLWAYVILLV